MSSPPCTGVREPPARLEIREQVLGMTRATAGGGADPRRFQFGLRRNEESPGPSRRRSGANFVVTAEAEGLEPPKACARRISSAVPYQLDYASHNNRLFSRDGRI